jgi:hypothetical protein
MMTSGRPTERNMNMAGLTFASRCGYEILVSSTQNVWKSGLTVDSVRAMPTAALRALSSADRNTNDFAYIMIAQSRAEEAVGHLGAIFEPIFDGSFVSNWWVGDWRTEGDVKDHPRHGCMAEEASAVTGRQANFGRQPYTTGYGRL